MKKLTTTETFHLEPFVFRAGPTFAGPVLFEVDEPEAMVNKIVRKYGDMITHRVVWSDGTGCLIKTKITELPAEILELAYGEARPMAELIEYQYHIGSGLN